MNNLLNFGSNFYRGDVKLAVPLSGRGMQCGPKLVLNSSVSFLPT